MNATDPRNEFDNAIYDTTADIERAKEIARKNDAWIRSRIANRKGNR